MGSTESLIEQQLDALAGGLDDGAEITLVVQPGEGQAIVRSNGDLEAAVRAIRAIQRQQRRQRERPPQRQATANFDPRR